MAEHDKWRCKECDWICTTATMLTAPSPFDGELLLSGCPACKSAESLIAACAIEGCCADATCGGTHKDGVYRNTCGEHADWLRPRGVGTGGEAQPKGGA